MKKQSIGVTALALAAVVTMGVAFFAPIWSVSLTAPNYPADRFPDGIRIVFGFDGVHNGCTTPPKTARVSQETLQEDLGWRSESGTLQAGAANEPSGVDCVREMNTINHYVGMRPIGVGAPVEINLSRYIVALFVVMLLAFALNGTRLSLPLLALGLAGVCGWMGVDLFALGRMSRFVAQYKTEAGKYFNEADRIAQWCVTLEHATLAVALGLSGLMALLVVLVWRRPGFQLTLGIVPGLLAGYFVAVFAAWLWFFGHHMHPWGAFTLKPFMPTVFGDGHVAQFTTHSYPSWGFGLLVATFLLMVAAVARRRLELAEERPPLPKPPIVAATPHDPAEAGTQAGTP
jgi:hypothetical protein